MWDMATDRRHPNGHGWDRPRWRQTGGIQKDTETRHTDGYMEGGRESEGGKIEIHGGRYYTFADYRNRLLAAFTHNPFAKMKDESTNHTIQEKTPVCGVIKVPLLL